MSEETKRILDELKEKFKRENIKSQSGDDIIRHAVELGYADMSKHAAGHKPEIKDKCVVFLTSKIQKYVESESKQNFDEWHKGTCKDLKKEMTRAGFTGTIGRAQKVINMAFKYLSLLDKKNEYNLPTDELHMALDSYTLNWYHSIPDRHYKIDAWSKLDDYNTYIIIQGDIKTYINKKPNYFCALQSKRPNLTINNEKFIQLPDNVFDAEFIIWEGEKNREKYLNLIKVLANIKEDKWFIGKTLLAEFERYFKP